MRNFLKIALPMWGFGGILTIIWLPVDPALTSKLIDTWGVGLMMLFIGTYLNPD